ncbi:MAG: hypothetical protein DME76_14715 [Verrucomicrobia bacterium]|nr:MAG: hypothetical protein DME76_14715 [Verrucomicrobiota bacterium]
MASANEEADSLFRLSSTPHFTLRANRFSLREFAAENLKPPLQTPKACSSWRVVGETFGV